MKMARIVIPLLTAEKSLAHGHPAGPCELATGPSHLFGWALPADPASCKETILIPARSWDSWWRLLKRQGISLQSRRQDLAVQLSLNVTETEFDGGFTARSSGRSVCAVSTAGKEASRGLPGAAVGFHPNLSTCIPLKGKTRYCR